MGAGRGAIGRRPTVPIIAMLLSGVFSAGLTVVRTTEAGGADFTSVSSAWTAGQVALSDDDSGTAAFSTAAPRNDGALSAGQVLTRCIAVQYSGSWTGPGPVASIVKVYGAASGALAPYLGLTIEQGTGATFPGCTGFTSEATVYSGTLDSFATSASAYASGVGSWQPLANPQTKVYRLVVTASSNPAAAGLTATGSFTWEAQAAPVTYQQSVAQDAPFAYYPFDEASGTLADDTIGTRDGTHTSMTVGAGPLFAGSVKSVTATGSATSHTAIPIDAATRLNASFTIEFWVQRNSAGASSFPAILSTGGGTGVASGYLVYWHVAKDTINFKRMNLDSFMTVDGGFPSTATHVAFTYDEPSKTLKGYINGAMTKTYVLGTAYADSTTTQDLWVGSLSAGNPSLSTYDDLALYETALPADRIAAHYNAR